MKVRSSTEHDQISSKYSTKRDVKDPKDLKEPKSSFRKVVSDINLNVSRDPPLKFFAFS